MTYSYTTLWDVTEPMEGFPWDLVAGVTFLAPMYVALFLYGYRSKPIWDVTIVDNKCKSVVLP